MKPKLKKDSAASQVENSSNNKSILNNKNHCKMLEKTVIQVINQLWVYVAIKMDLMTLK